jgi:hypothetical protein
LSGKNSSQVWGLLRSPTQGKPAHHNLYTTTSLLNHNKPAHHNSLLNMTNLIATAS